MMRFLVKNAPEKGASPQKRPREDEADEGVRRSPRKQATEGNSDGSASTSGAAAAPIVAPVASQLTKAAGTLPSLAPDVATLIEGLSEGAWRDALMPEFRKGYFAELASKVTAEVRSRRHTI